MPLAVALTHALSLLILLGLASGCQSGSSSTNSASASTHSTPTALAAPSAVAGTPAAPTSSAAVLRASLSTGELYVPARYTPSGNQVDLFFHFHGYGPVVEREFDAAGIAAALVIVNYNGFSSAYSGPFQDAGLLQSIIDEALPAVGAARGVASPRLGALVLCSFSAGYGATREVLMSGRYDSSVSEVLLADSLHSGYVGGAPNPSQMQPFVDFALRASVGLDHRLALSHSSIVPPGYASTTETADALITALGLSRQSEVATNAQGMQQLNRARLGHFSVRGYSGQTAADHSDHLQHISLLLKESSLAR